MFCLLTIEMILCITIFFHTFENYIYILKLKVIVQLFEKNLLMLNVLCKKIIMIKAYKPKKK